MSMQNKLVPCYFMGSLLKTSCLQLESCNRTIWEPGKADRNVPFETEETTYQKIIVRPRPSYECSIEMQVGKNVRTRDKYLTEDLKETEMIIYSIKG